MDAAPSPGAATTAGPARRKRRRRRRALVRNDVGSRLYNLTLDVNALRSEVQRLELLRHVFSTRALVAHQSQLGALMATSTRVFEVFRHGYRPAQWRPSHAQFVAAAFDDRVTVSEYATGRERLLEQWRLYSELFLLGVFGVSTLRVIVSDTDEREHIVEALGEFDGRITPAALDVVFPHVVGDRALERMLLGRDFRCPTRTLLHFDAHGRITRFDANADMVAAMSELVGRSPELVAALLGGARINDASMIEVVDDAEDLSPARAQGEEDGAWPQREDFGLGTTVADECEAPGDSRGPDRAPLEARDATTNRQSVAFILS